MENQTNQEIVNRFNKYPELYDKFRPIPPPELILTLKELAGGGNALTVADIGCGPGNSTSVWKDDALRIIGIDPSEEMIKYAESRYGCESVSFLRGTGADTHLADSTADIVTFSSSIHWMDINTIFDEIHRILKPGGVLGAFGPQLPPLPTEYWQVAAEFNKFLAFILDLDKRISGSRHPVYSKWDDIRQKAKSCGLFAYNDELCFHNYLYWTAADFCSYIKTFSYVSSHLSDRNPEAEEAYNKFCDLTESTFKGGRIKFLQSYRMITSIKSF